MLRNWAADMEENMVQRQLRRLSFVACLTALSFIAAPQAFAANSEGCEGGGFRIAGLINGASTQSVGRTTLAANRFGSTIQIVGRYVEFTIVTSTFAVENYVFTGAANNLDMTGGVRTVVWSERRPDHRGATLSGGISVDIRDEDIVIEREGSAVSMKIQAKDCAQGGIFQMEPEREDNTATRITHVLAPGVFYFDNPNFRAREGDTVPYKDTTVVVPDRINIASNTARRFIARDSAQVAERVDSPTCPNQIRTRSGAFETVLHCGQVSIWDVASGGRMGFVTGEDAHEVAPPATDCTRRCQAQNRVRGRSVKLGWPFPVPAAVRLQPPTP
ncbi:predicted protein [alpha proteobacterium U9-1i]|nr:predicted protein [alpha proteobacterium U9-1i]